MTELRCSRDLGLALGAIGPSSIAHHRELRDAGHLLVRDSNSGIPLFWQWKLEQNDMAIARSS